MKFLTFNILVGAALAWLLLGGDGASALWASMTPARDRIQSSAIDCPATTTGPAKLEAVTAKPAAATSSDVGQVASAVSATGDANRSAPKSTTSDLPVSRADAVQVAAVDNPVEEGELPPSREAAGVLSRGDSLRLLAENMELFSLERIGK